MGVAGGSATTPQHVAGRGRDKRAERLLLEDTWDAKLANMPPAAWEPISYLASEREKAIERIEDMEVPEDLEWVQKLALARWEQVGEWIAQLEQKSVGVRGLRSAQLTHIATAGNQQPIRQTDGVVPQQPNGKEATNGAVPARR